MTGKQPSVYSCQRAAGLGSFRFDTDSIQPPTTMLRALSIRHFAIIDRLELDFTSGFTAITGETGAGKSILIDALGLLLGDRADSALVAADADQAELSARFELGPEADEARAWLEQQAMTDDDELILRRVISAQGQSRAWINGRSATIGQLADLGRHLVEIHGQHAHQQLERSDVQRRLLDQQIAAALPTDTTAAHHRWQLAREALSDFERDAGDPAQLELLRFQVRELQDLALKAGEYDELESEQERLARSDEIRSIMATASRLLDGDDDASVRGLLIETLGRLDRVRSLDGELDGIWRMLDEARINIDEAIASLERQDPGDSETDDERLADINRRLERALDLARKHRVEPDALPELTDTLSGRFARQENQDEQRITLDATLDQALQQWRKAALALSQARQQAAKRLGQDVSALLAELGMDQAKLIFEVGHDDQAEPAHHGADRIRILFSANPGQPPRSLARVASGGELSRVSLALMIAARPKRGPVVRIFDEVDAGIGGQTARVVGAFLRQVAAGGQAFCVTHLAQVAACADHQFRVAKSAGQRQTHVEVEGLSDQARREEIARMLGGPVSERSLDHAAELLASVSSS